MVRLSIPLCGPLALAMIGQATSAFAADCFVDSVGGSDTNNGSSETAAVKSIAKIPSTCTAVKFKRGSQFSIAKGVQNLGIANMNSVKTLTNYGDLTQPLPKFVKDHVGGSGGLIQVYMGGVTIDGLYLSGSKSANSMSQLADGIGVMLGANSTIKNCEITLCDIGMMTSGDNVKVVNNYVHDLSISVDAAPGVDPNQVGGAEGIFVNSSHVEVAYNRFVNCSTAAQWVSNTNSGGVRCDGGATEVTVPYAGEVTDVHIHHNFSYNSCGFFEVSSMPSSGSGTYVKGKFTNSEFHDNVMVDSGWISLLQINNTKLTNVRWENNTIVHHFLSTVTDASGTAIDMNDFASSYLQVIAFNNTSSGVAGGGELSQGDVYWTNNLWYFDPQIFKKLPSAGVDATHASTDQFVKNIVITGDKFFTSDPGFVDIASTTDPRAYDLKPGSAAIDQGVSDSNIAADVPTDFADRARPVGTAYDLGAFEFQNSAAGGSNGSGGNSSVAAGGAVASGGRATTGGNSTAQTAGNSTSIEGSPTGGATSSSTDAAAGNSSTAPGTASNEGSCSCKVAGRHSSSTAAALLGLLACAAGFTRGRMRKQNRP